jgi:hypothetical protein
VDAGGHLLAQRFQRLLPCDRTAPAALGRCPALTGVHGVTVRTVELLDRPLGRRRPHLLPPSPCCLAPLFPRDPSVDLGEGRRRLLDHHPPGKTEQLEPRRFFVHVFDCKEVRY